MCVPNIQIVKIKLNHCITITKLFPFSHIHFFQRDTEPLTNEIWNPNLLLNIFLGFSRDFKFIDSWICIISAPAKNKFQDLLIWASHFLLQLSYPLHLSKEKFTMMTWSLVPLYLNIYATNTWMCFNHNFVKSKNSIIGMNFYLKGYIFFMIYAHGPILLFLVICLANETFHHLWFI